MILLTIILALMAWMTAAIVFRGFVLSVLWGWFMVPLGVVGITPAWGVGISCMVAMFTAGIKREPAESAVESLLSPFVTSGLMLLVGWLAHVVMT